MSNNRRPDQKVEVSFDPSLTLPALLEQHLQNQPRAVALIQDDTNRSWEQSIQRIYQMANGLIELGIQRGDRVALLSRNSMAYSEFFAAILISGGCAVPLQSMISDHSLKLMLKDSGAKVLVVARELAAMTEPFLADQSQLLAGGLMGFDFEDKNTIDFESWLETQSKAAPGITLDPEDEFNIIYSSGTTGIPKGIVHSHRTRQALAAAIMTMGFDSQSMNLISTPLYSNTTITTWWPSLCAGTAQIISSKFNAEDALKLIQKHKVTHAMLVPVQYDRIMRLENFSEFDLSSLQVKFSTSAPLRAALKADIIERFPGELLEFYGLTEGGVSCMFVGSVAREEDKLGSVGPASRGCILKILDEEGNELPNGEIGEIVGRSGSMSNGYLNREEANLEMHWYDSDGLLYYKSGDAGYLDKDGWLFLSDRRKDMIISGGFNIYATDLELVLLEHEHVHEVAVVALSSRDWGETPLAVIVKEAGSTTHEESLRTWANAKLGKLQRISQLVYVDELPKSSIGKILKKELRERFATLADI
ncbi:MAG: long-chain acyl-CoA synthetase [Halioglobus sp.]|jgi:acyl-CoA synthetase (AMP-forming)/AMP-acid ligase II